jgi:general secretion pathway protein M
MTLAERPAFGRATALTILALLIALFFIGPFAAYCSWIDDNSEALADKATLLQRYRALAANKASVPVTPGPALLYPDMPESQASALLQETVKNTAAAAHVQVQGLQVLHSDSAGGATRIGVRVRGSGDMASLRSLIYTIEAARPLLYPDNLSIQSHATSADATPSTLDFQLDISGFKTEPPS